jgi:NAD(P)-dependent dehydrogenase (short-subunit alcohol dehydrogenase family)/rhamnose utilization protein RhaD (predicted bifunctional aldolase and dehydrogenase)
MWIKASGWALATIEPEGFLELDLDPVLGLLERKDFSGDRDRREEEIAQVLLDSRIDPPDPSTRPSVESTLHAQMPQAFVLHTHGELANGIACSREGERALASLELPKRVKPVWMPYVDPGLPLAQALQTALSDYQTKHNDAPNVVFMAKHGILSAGETAGEAENLLLDCDKAIRKTINSKKGRNPRIKKPPRHDHDLEAALIPALRSLLPEPGWIIRRIEEPLLGAEVEQSLANTPPLLPDQVVYCGGYPLWIPSLMSLQAGVIRREARRAMEAYLSQYEKPPRVILIEGLGAYSAGPNPKEAGIAGEMYASAMRMRANTLYFGGPNPMTKREWTFIDNWSVEKYRRKKAAGSSSAGRAAGKVALVTGAGQGVGREIAEGLASEGARLVLVDLNQETLNATIARMTEKYGEGSAVGMIGNVTSEEQIRAAVRKAVATFGGLDVMISNAGILKAFKVTDFPADVWRSILDVNLVGFFICAKAAAEVMQYQGSGDIIQINSKSGKIGSKYNSAYAASKFGGIGLTQSLALDLIEDGIRVNAICPGNFLDLPLWSAPGGLFDQYRKKFNNVSREEVRKIYESKVPMGRGCRVSDVVRTILYILEQEYETGQAYNVTGGQEMR